MSKINLFITNASGDLDDYLDEIKTAVKDAEAFIFQNFNVAWDIDLVVTDRVYDATIPEDGVCGRTFTSDFITFYIDPKVMTRVKLYEMLCHELSHAARWGKNSEFSYALFGNLILEGLAMVVEEEAISVYSNNPEKEQTFCLSTMQKRTEKEYQEIYEKLLPMFDFTHEKYNFHEIFIAGNKDLPRWAGYSLGYYLIKQFIEKTGKSIFEINALPYAEFAKILR